MSKSSKGNETIKVLAYKSFSKSLQKRGNLEEGKRETPGGHGGILSKWHLTDINGVL